MSPAWRRPVRIAVALALLSSPAASQTPRPRPPGPPPGPDSSVCRIAQDSATRVVRDTVFASIRTLDPLVVLPADYAQIVLDEVREFWRPPAPLKPPTYRPYAFVDGKDTIDAARPWFAVEVTFTLTAAGRLGELVGQASSTSVPIDESVTNALYAADSAGAFPGLPEARTDSITLVLALTMRRDVAALTIPLVLVANPVTLPAGPALASLDSSNKWVIASTPGDRVDGKARIHFVVDERGRIMPGTTRVLDPLSAPALERARTDLARLRFAPAVVQGCAVRSIVEQRVPASAVAP